MFANMWTWATCVETSQVLIKMQIPGLHTRLPASEPLGAGPGAYIFWELLRGCLINIDFWEWHFLTSFKFRGFWCSALLLSPAFCIWKFKSLQEFSRPRAIGLIHRFSWFSQNLSFPVLSALIQAQQSLIKLSNPALDFNLLNSFKSLQYH